MRLEPGQHVRMRFAAEFAGSRARGTRGMPDCHRRPSRRGTRVEGERVFDNGSLGVGISARIDDSFGRFDDLQIRPIIPAVGPDPRIGKPAPRPAPAPVPHRTGRAHGWLATLDRSGPASAPAT